MPKQRTAPANRSKQSKKQPPKVNGTPKKVKKRANGSKTSLNGHQKASKEEVDDLLNTPIPWEEIGETPFVSKFNPKSLARPVKTSNPETQEKLDAAKANGYHTASEIQRKYFTEEAKRQAQVDHALKWKRNNRPQGREIGPWPLEINWPRRLACKASLQLFCETYLKPVFKLAWSTDQLACLNRAERVCREGGKFAVAMPRGGGKTAIVRAATLWACLYNYKHFIYNIGSTEPKSTQTLKFIKVQLENNSLFHNDFPEICWSVVKCEGNNRLGAFQLFNGEPTHISLGTEALHFPICLLPYTFVEHYLANDPTSVFRVGDERPRWRPPTSDGPGLLSYEQAFSTLQQATTTTTRDPHADLPAGSVTISPKEERAGGQFGNGERWIASNAGVILRCSGIDGSIRGEAEVDPVTLEQPRPDLVILDDVQKDQKADSPLLCEKLIRLIDGAVTGLAGSGEHIDALLPCTVIREGDAADTYLDPIKKPDWQGIRCQMVTSWPEGLTDFEITNDTPAGKLWNEYAEVRRKSLREKGDMSLATAFYKKHQKVMDEGYVVSWAERFDRRSELSAQQHAMNLRLQLGPMFLPEYQNVGRQLIATSDVLITAKQLAIKQVDFKRGVVPSSANFVVGHIDVQNEIMYWLVFAVDSDFNGTFIDYGVWPELKVPYFTKAQTESWSAVTASFFKKFPQHANKAIRSSSGKVRAPFEAKVYHALTQTVAMLMSKVYVRETEPRKEFKIQRLGIDTRWGQASDTIKRFIREQGIENIIPYYGQAMPPTHKQFEEYELREGWLFEHQLNPLVREPRWLMRPNPDGMWYMQADVNRLKDFLMARLATPLGSSGCVTLHSAPAEYHEMFANHLCSSEYPEPISARGMTKNQWTPREGTAYDNDWFDCAAACMALASTLGVSLKTSDYRVQPLRRRLSEIRDAKRGARAAARDRKGG